MVVGSTPKGCQVAVIGGGPGGYLAAIRLAQLKKDVILINNTENLGGICLNEGCIPSKALITAADFYHDTKHSSRMGIDISSVKLDLPRMVAWKDKIVKQLTAGVKHLIDQNGIQLVSGTASFLNDRQLIVSSSDDQVLVEFEQAIIATGSVPDESLDAVIDADITVSVKEALSPGSIPERLVIIGANYVGLELGSIYRKLGSRVHIVSENDNLLDVHDTDVSQTVVRRLKTLGIKLHLGCKFSSFETGEPCKIIVTRCSEEDIPIETDQIILSPPRKPNTQALDLTKAGIHIVEGFIGVNQQMETNVPGIYAVGDVVGFPMLAHKAYREAKVAADIIGGEPSAFDNVVIPAVVFTDPEIAWAGLSEKQAEAEGYRIVTGSFPFRASGRALTLSARDGFIKTIADADTQRILGISIVGQNASELISEAALAIEMGAFLDDISQTIHPHPTLSEGLVESVSAALGEAIHMINR